MDSMLLYSIESFPPLPNSINELSRLCSQSEPDIPAITSLVKNDPIIHTNLLHFANAPFHGLRNPIKDISQAFSLFGIQTMKGVALCSAIKELPFIDLTAYNITIDAWFSTMQKQQQFISHWIKNTDQTLFEQLGAIIHILEIGRLIGSYALMFTENPYHFTKTDPIKLLLEEINILGESTDTLAAKLFELWSFDPSMINHLRYSLNPAQSVTPSITAMLTCARMLYTLYGTAPLENVEPLLSQFNLDITHCKNAYDNTNKG